MRSQSASEASQPSQSSGGRNDEVAVRIGRSGGAMRGPTARVPWTESIARVHMVHYHVANASAIGKYTLPYQELLIQLPSGSTALPVRNIVSFERVYW